ncbi:MAG TPA: hypothetical protein VMW25_01080, partial [Clostridia bacterium]|nr:hypothetical protein [Clostridia bacterium]
VSESGEKAAQAMKAIREFARTSPLETEDVVQSFVRLRAVGIDPTMAQLKTIGGVAVLFNREMRDVLDSLIGLNKRTLRKLGVEIDRTGQTAIIQSGKIRREVNKDSASIRAALLEVWEERFPDAINTAANTTKSKVAIMKSNIFELAVVIGDKLKPAFDTVVVSIGNMAAKFKEFLALTRDDAETKAQTKIIEVLKNDAKNLKIEIKALEAASKDGTVALDAFLNPLDPKGLAVARAELKFVTEDIAKLEKIIKDKSDVGGSGDLGADSDKDAAEEAKKLAAEKAKKLADEKAKKLAQEQRDRFNAAQARVREFNALDVEIAEAQEKQKEEIAKAGADALKQIREDDYLDAKASWEKKQRLIDEEQA